MLVSDDAEWKICSVQRTSFRLRINVNNKYKSKPVLLNLIRKIWISMTKYINYDAIEMEGQFLYDSAAMAAAPALPAMSEG